MTYLRHKMYEAMELAGLAPKTQETYIHSVKRLAGFYNRSPEQITENEVRDFFLNLLDIPVAKGTFKTVRFGKIGVKCTIYLILQVLSTLRCAFNLPMTVGMLPFALTQIFSYINQCPPPPGTNTWPPISGYSFCLVYSTKLNHDVYTQRHNRLLKTDGSLFRGRYKAIVVRAGLYFA